MRDLRVVVYDANHYDLNVEYFRGDKEDRERLKTFTINDLFSYLGLDNDKVLSFLFTQIQALREACRKDGNWFDARRSINIACDAYVATDLMPVNTGKMMKILARAITSAYNF